jgi:hypothetical protein
MTRFLLPSDICGFVDMRRPLWREDGSVFYSVQCAIYNIFYCLRFETMSLYLYPPGTGWPGYTPRHWVLFWFDSVLYHVYSLEADHREHIRWPAMDTGEPLREHLFLYCCIYSALHRNGSYPIVACVFVVARMCSPRCCLEMGLHVKILVLFGAQIIALRLENHTRHINTGKMRSSLMKNHLV